MAVRTAQLWSSSVVLQPTGETAQLWNSTAMRWPWARPLSGYTSLLCFLCPLMVCSALPFSVSPALLHSGSMRCLSVLSSMFQLQLGKQSSVERESALAQSFYLNFKLSYISYPLSCVVYFCISCIII